MSKTILGLTIVSLILFVGASPAGAQSSVGFGNGGNGSAGQVTFISNGGGTASLDLGTCDVSNVCTLSGLNGVTVSSGTYSFTTTETGGVGDDIQVGGFIGATLNRSISMNGAMTHFMWNDGIAGDSLAGDIVWTSAFTDGHATISGTLSITSSSFSGALGIGGQASIDFTTNQYGTSLSTAIFGAPAGSTEGATLSSGEVVAPEPSSMLLFGSGLLLAGGILRRRLVLA
jgi:hypothetical protein